MAMKMHNYNYYACLAGTRQGALVTSGFGGDLVIWWGSLLRKLTLCSNANAPGVSVTVSTKTHFSAYYTFPLF